MSPVIVPHIGDGLEFADKFEVKYTTVGDCISYPSLG